MLVPMNRTLQSLAGDDHWLALAIPVGVIVLLAAATSLEWYYLLTTGALVAGVTELTIRLVANG